MSELNTVTPTNLFTSVNNNEPVEHKVQSVVVDNENEEAAVSALEAKKTAEEEVALSPSEVTETIDEMNNFLQEMKRNLSFSMDEQSGQSVIIVKDSETEEVIRQIPSEELVVLRKKMDDLTGILFDTKV